MENISVLTHDETVDLDTEQLGALYAQLGESNADAVVCRALEELANRLSLIERSYYQSDFPALAKAARGLVGIADQVGMKKLSVIAKTVADLSKAGDAPALSATLARLIRMGDRSLAAIWEVQDMNGAL
ncbi:MAG: hypothetical protein ACPG5U_01500 [Planktomarina sp.]